MSSSGGSQTGLLPSGDQTGVKDTAAIQAYINAVQAGVYPDEGGVVQLGNGTFFINAPLLVTADNITIAGVGMGNPTGNKNTNANPQYGGTVIQGVAGFAGGSYMLRFGQAGTPSRTLTGCFLRNISLDGQLLPANIGGVFWQVAKGGGEHVYVFHVTGASFTLDGNGSPNFPNGCWDNHLWDWTSDTPASHGFVLQNDATDNDFMECTSKFSGGNGYNLDSTCASNRWTGGYIYNCTGICINAATAMELKIVGVRMQDSNGGVYLASGFITGGFLITGCTFRNMSFAADNTTDAVNLSASTVTVGGEIVGNDFTVDQGTGNGTANSWNRPRYLVNVSSANCKGVEVGPAGLTSTRTDGSSWGTASLNDLGTSTVVSLGVGQSGLPEVKFGGGLRVLWHSGNPNGNVTALAGSICLNTAGGAGTTLYVSEAGGTVWVGK